MSIYLKSANHLLRMPKILSDKISKNAYSEFRQKYTWEFRAERILATRIKLLLSHFILI